VAKITRLVDGFSDSFGLEASPVEGQSLLQKYKKKRKRNGKKKLKASRHKSLSHLIFDFCTCPSKNVIFIKMWC